jgi:hypothetical protein
MGAPEPLNLTELKRMNIKDLAARAQEMSIDGSSSMRRQELIFALLQAQAEKKGEIYGEGVLETCPTASASSGPRLQLPARPGRHLRLAVADPALQPAHGRHRERSDPPAEGQRALLRAAQGRAA